MAVLTNELHTSLQVVICSASRSNSDKRAARSLTRTRIMTSTMHMYSTFARLRPSTCSSHLFKPKYNPRTLGVARRALATNTQNRVDPSSSSAYASSLLDTAQKRARAPPPDDTVGPFNLGYIRRDGPAPKKWSELSTSGKVVRTTARTTNLSVVLLGAGLFAVLTYALTSELFSRNSPTVLYGEACEKIKNSPRLTKYLKAPLRFHNTPPSVVRPRHRGGNVSSQIYVDSAGREHMFLSFYVSSSPSSIALSESDSYLDFASAWVHSRWETIQGMNFDEAVEWAKERGEQAWESSRRSLRYLVGQPISATQALPEKKSNQHDVEHEQDQGVWGKLTGLFGGIKGLRGSTNGDGVEETVKAADGKIFQEGEVYAELVKNDEGYFTFRYLLVELRSDPGSRTPLRVWIERAPGVRENEPTMRFH